MKLDKYTKLAIETLAIGIAAIILAVVVIFVSSSVVDYRDGKGGREIAFCYSLESECVLLYTGQE